MLQCGGCAQQVVQQIPILLNPVVWVMALAALTTGVSIFGKKGGK